MNTQRQHHPERNQGTSFQINPGSILGRYYKITKYELRQDLDQFEIGIGKYLSFRKGMLRDFDIQLRDCYLAEIDTFQGKINQIDLLLPHDLGFIWNQGQSTRDSKDNCKERVQTLGFSHRTVTNYIKFFHLSTKYPRILTSSA